MENRLFLLDKNHVLKEVQKELRLMLQAQLIDLVKDGYFQLFNPLRLPDDKSQLIEDYRPEHLSFFDDFYDTLAGFYRYEIGDNQLELLFDGRSHYDKYVEDWPKAFRKYIYGLAQKKNFITACLELSVFYDPENRKELAQNRLKLCCFDHFGLKIYKHKGIQEYKSASA